MNGDDTLIKTFEEIVADVIPMAHWMCELCFPDDEPGQKESVCGVILLGLPPLPGHEECEECIEIWPQHVEDHLFDLLGGDDD